MPGHLFNALRNRERRCLHCGNSMPYQEHQCPKCHYDEDEDLVGSYGRVRSREYLRERNRSYIFLGAVALGIVLLTLIFGVVF